MFNSIVGALFRFFTSFALSIASVITLPIVSIFNALFPTNFYGSFYIDLSQHFFVNYFCRYIRFARDVFLNLTSLDPTFFNIILLLFMARFVFTFSTLAFRFLYRIYSFLRGHILGSEKI